MKPLLFVLLAASLIGNVALVVMARRTAVIPDKALASNPARAGAEAATSPVPGQTTTIVATKRSSENGAAKVPFAWPAVQTDQDLHHMVAGLRAAGYPPAVVRAVVQQLLKERFASREPNAGQPYWKHNNQTPEAVAAQVAVNNERKALLEALLGADARPSAMLDAETRLRRYGPMSDEKIDLLAQIESDYGEMSAEAWAKRRGNIATSSQTMLQTQQLMEQEKQADMAAVLTPEELAEYEQRNSPAARTLINKLRNMDLTEAEYVRLYQAQKAFNDANPQRAIMDQAAHAQRQTAQLALNEELRTVLGESRFYPFLESSDYQYANVAKGLTSYPAVTPATAYEVYRLQTELSAYMMQATRVDRPDRTSPERIAETRATVESYNSRLDALLGTEAAEAYRKQGGRMFNSYRNVPRPAAPAAGTPATPLVPVGK